jgi:23S rRNA pseudouridine1911/1915/1917 synthase
MKKIIVKDNIPNRLDVWLAAKLTLSRSQIQKMIKNKEILLNDKIVLAHHVLKLNDVLKITPKKIVTEKNKKIKQALILPKIEIIKETEDYLVINKPAGLLMHGADYETRYSLVDWLIKHYPKIRKIGEDPSRPGIVHRLDKDVSGLVVVAKTQDSFDDLKKQFKKRLVTKCYEALVYGAGLPNEGEINFRLERSTKGYRMAAKPQNQTGKIAITEFMIKKQFHNYTLLDVKIKTGRTHQIRAHLAAYNHPVVGDDLYGSSKNKLFNKKLGLNRVFLVATNLSFTDLAGQKQNFSINLPAELKNVLKILK